MSADASLVFPVQSTVACKGCDMDVDVIWFCKNCSASLCTTCKQKHSTEKFLRDHQVVERSASVLLSHGAWKIAQPCQKHKGKDISTYCNDCNEPCCLECMEESHQRHSFTSIEKKYMGEEARLNSYVNELEKKTIQSMRSDITRLNKLLESCTADYETAKKDVEKFREKLKSTVDQSCDAINKDLERKQNDSCLVLQNSIKNVEKQIQNVNELIEKVETRIRKGGLDLIEYHPNPPSSFTPPHTTLSYTRPRFIPDENIISAIGSCIGNVNYDKVRDKVKEEEMVRIPSVDTSTIRSFQAKIRGGSIEPVGNDRAWISWIYSETVYLHDVSGKVAKSIKVMGSDGVRDMAVKTTGDLIVTCFDRKVRHVSMTGKITVLMHTQPFYPYGVCLTDKEEIVICMSDQGDKNHVAMYTSDGKTKIRDIVARDDKGTLMFSYPYRVVMNGECVTVLNNEINLMNADQSGRVMWVYDGSQTKLSESFRPAGMCKDKYSNILVSDMNNHCVHCFNREGKLLQITVKGDNGIEYPWGIGLSSDTDKLWLGSTLGCTVWVMSYCIK